jgi:outer membrane protein W
LFIDTFGARLTARKFSKFVPYAGAGIGAGYLSSSVIYTGSSFATRVNVGADIPINDLLSWKVDVSRLSLHTGFLGGGWTSGANIMTGITLNIGQ